MFRRLASDPTEQHSAWAQELWFDTLKIDFSTEEMDASEALELLGLARLRTDEAHPEEPPQRWFGPPGHEV